MKRDEFARNLAAGTYDLIVLDILRDGPNWQDGTLYPVLRHLEQQGLVTSKWLNPKEGRQRRYYRLTPRGRRVCQQLRHRWTTSTQAISALLHRPSASR